MRPHLLLHVGGGADLEELHAGNLGTIQYIDSVRINLGLVQPDADVFWDLLPHDISILDHVIPGGFRPTAVSAIGSDPIGAGHASLGYVTMTMPDAAVAHVHLSWLSPVKIRSFVIGGSDRHLVWNDTDPAQRISLYERGIDVASLKGPDARREQMVQYRIGDMLAPALPEAEALQGVVREFAAAIREGRAPLTDGHAGVRVLDILEATHRSLASDGALGAGVDTDMSAPIPLVDLSWQHAQIVATGSPRLQEAMAAGQFIGGGEVADFEREYAQCCGVAHCVGVANGTDAIEIALQAAGIGPGDEVVVPANTFIATIEGVLAVGAWLGSSTLTATTSSTSARPRTPFGEKPVPSSLSTSTGRPRPPRRLRLLPPTKAR